MAGLFAKINPSAARLGTLLARHARELPFRAGGAGWTFSAAKRKGGVHGVVAYGALGSVEFSLWLDEPNWRLAAAAILEVDAGDISGLPPVLVQAALEAFFSDALVAIENALGLPISLSRIETGDFPPLSSSHSFVLRREDGLVLSGAWLAPNGEWREILESVLLDIPPMLSLVSDALRLVGVLSMGVWRVPADCLAGLEKGDAVLSPAAAMLSLTVGRRLRFAAVYEKGKLMADGKVMFDAAAPDVETAEPGVLAEIDEAEVELRAEVGRLNVTLGELKRLCVGEVVEFATSLDAPATLVAGGRVVAIGELVELGGRVGVRITAMARERSDNA